MFCMKASCITSTFNILPCANQPAACQALMSALKWNYFTHAQFIFQFTRASVLIVLSCWKNIVVPRADDIDRIGIFGNASSQNSFGIGFLSIWWHSNPIRSFQCSCKIRFFIKYLGSSFFAELEIFTEIWKCFSWSIWLNLNINLNLKIFQQIVSCTLLLVLSQWSDCFTMLGAKGTQWFHIFKGTT